MCGQSLDRAPNVSEQVAMPSSHEPLNLAEFDGTGVQNQFITVLSGNEIEHGTERYADTAPISNQYEDEEFLC